MAASFLGRLTGALQIIGSALALKGAVGTATISATTTLTNRDAYVLRLATNSSTTRTLVLPPYDDGRIAVVVNTGSSGNIAVTDAAGNAVITVTPKQRVVLMADGTAWLEVIGPAMVRIADPGNAGAIPVTYSGVCAITTGASGETRTLAAPSFVGQRITLTHDVDGGGDAVITSAVAINRTGNNTITFADAGRWIDLVGAQVAGALVWRAVGSDAALSTV